MKTKRENFYPAVKSGRGGWTRKARTCKAWTAGGLAIYKFDPTDKAYRIGHIGTGRCVARDLFSLKTARLAMSNLLDTGIDWTFTRVADCNPKHGPTVKRAVDMARRDCAWTDDDAAPAWLADPMKRELNVNLLKYTAGHLLTCPRCGKIMDYRDTVIVSLANGERAEARCGTCSDAWIKVLADCNLGVDKLDIVDGRLL
jgi:hypothetical protein